MTVLQKSGADMPRQTSFRIRRIDTIRFDEKRALAVLTVLANAWTESRMNPHHGGFYSRLVPPQRRWTPEELRSDPHLLGQWLFFAAIPMRGGINSDDAFRFLKALWRSRPRLFDPRAVAEMTENDLIAAFENVGREFQQTTGAKRAGTLSYKKEEHARHWRENAVTLLARWDGDVRNIYEGVTSFEEAFGRAGFKGMRRKIFALLSLWLQEFDLIPSFPLPIVVDFHCLRLLLAHEILQAPHERLGPGRPRVPARRRPRALWKYRGVRITEQLVNEVMRWSEDFLQRTGLSSYAVSHALWYLSRELCASYHGNRAWTKVVGKRRITARLVDPKSLASIAGWPANYRDPCRLCPIHCRTAYPSATYYDWGFMLRAGKHVPYPGRQQELSAEWRTLGSTFTNSKVRHEGRQKSSAIRSFAAQPQLFPTNGTGKPLRRRTP